MKTFTIASLAACIAVVSGKVATFVDPATNQTIRHFDCDVNRGKASAHFNETTKFLLRNTRRPNSLQAISRRQSVSPTITINTYFHVLQSTAKAGLITPDMATQQAAALNKAYNSIGVSFTLVNTSFTTNDAYAVGDGTAMDDAKKALRAGTYKDLNLYFHSDLTGGILGTCTLPSEVTAQTLPSQYYTDGCNINANTMPGGSMTGYNLGMTAVHETGHWLGLLHTFEGYACTGDGDMIADTPMQSTSTDGCPSKPAKDSCPSTTGVDPIHNYMDYSSDACYENFTPGQVSRIQTLWNTYRSAF